MGGIRALLPAMAALLTVTACGDSPRSGRALPGVPETPHAALAALLRVPGVMASIEPGEWVFFHRSRTAEGFIAKKADGTVFVSAEPAAFRFVAGLGRARVERDGPRRTFTILEEQHFLQTIRRGSPAPEMVAERATGAGNLVPTGEGMLDASTSAPGSLVRFGLMPAGPVLAGVDLGSSSTFGMRDPADLRAGFAIPATALGRPVGRGPYVFASFAVAAVPMSEPVAGCGDRYELRDEFVLGWIEDLDQPPRGVVANRTRVRCPFDRATRGVSSSLVREGVLPAAPFASVAADGTALTLLGPGAFLKSGALGVFVGGPVAGDPKAAESGLHMGLVIPVAPAGTLRTEDMNGRFGFVYEGQYWDPKLPPPGSIATGKDGTVDPNALPAQRFTFGTIDLEGGRITQHSGLARFDMTDVDGDSDEGSHDHFEVIPVRIGGDAPDSLAVDAIRVFHPGHPGEADRSHCDCILARDGNSCILMLRPETGAGLPDGERAVGLLFRTD